MPKLSLKWFLTYGLLITIALVCVSYFWIDKPLVEWAFHYHLRDYRWLHRIQQLPEIFPFIAFVGILFVAIRSAWRSPSRIECALLYTSLSYVLVAFFTKIFKMIFARPWPATWIDNNPSWLNNGVYDFFWMIDSTAYRSFPSGHTSAMFAVVIVLCSYYPALRRISSVVCFFVIAGLITNYYHFLGDIIAGAYLGTITALFTLTLSHKDQSC